MPALWHEGDSFVAQSSEVNDHLLRRRLRPMFVCMCERVLLTAVVVVISAETIPKLRRIRSSPIGSIVCEISTTTEATLRMDGGEFGHHSGECSLAAEILSSNTMKTAAAVDNNLRGKVISWGKVEIDGDWRQKKEGERDLQAGAAIHKN